MRKEIFSNSDIASTNDTPKLAKLTCMAIPVSNVLHVLAISIWHVVKVVGGVLIVNAIRRDEVLPLNAMAKLHCHLEHCNRQHQQIS